MDRTLRERISGIASRLRSRLINDRRHFHANPELSFKEFDTSAYIQSRLHQMQIPFKTFGETGVIGTISGQNGNGKLIALRADMDALPILEKNHVEYKSKNDGVMHACGHDAHMASLLGTTTILKEIADRFAGTILVIFQPAEEVLPGGASLLINEGLLSNPKPDLIIGQHVAPFLPLGTVGIRKGEFMASMDEIFMTISGKGGHAAQPHTLVDPVMITAQILVQLQQVVSRKANPLTPTVLSFGKLLGDGAINIIPDEVKLEGTFRTMDEGWRDQAHELISQISNTTAQAMGGKCDIKINKGYPVLINNQNLTEQVHTLMNSYIGKEKVIQADKWMAAEDFARYAQIIPACFYLLGVGKPDTNNSSLHTPTFDIDEEALVSGAGLMAFLALSCLENNDIT